MKKILFVLALTILAIALPAQARDRHRHQQGQPVFGPSFWGLMNYNRAVYVEQPLLEIQARTRYGIFNSQSVYTDNYGYPGVSRRSPEEELARCVGRILKDARKNHQSTSVEQAGAICSGQPIPAVAAPEPPAATPVPQPQKALLIPVSNQVGERVCIDGKPHDADELFTVDPTGTPLVRTLTDGNCLEAGFVWANHHTRLNLICTKKGK